MGLTVALLTISKFLHSKFFTIVHLAEEQCIKDKNYMKQRRVLEMSSMNTIIYGFHKRWKILKITQNINNKDSLRMKSSVMQYT